MVKIIVVHLASILVFSNSSAQLQFELPITVTDGDNEQVLTIGVHPDGSEADNYLDRFAPPPPPSGVFDAVIRIPGQAERYFKKILDNEITQKIFYLDNRPGGAQTEITLDWDNEELSDRFEFIIDDGTDSGLLNMKEVSSHTYTPARHPTFGTIIPVTLTLDPVLELPPAPDLISPHHQATGVGINPRLRWSRVDEATTYRLQVAEDDKFDHLIFSIDDIPDTSHVLTGLHHSTTYFWRAAASGEGGDGEWSEAFYFETIAEPVHPTEHTYIPAGDNIQVEFELYGLLFSGNVSAGGEVAVAVYDSAPYGGNLPEGVPGISDLYIEITGNVEFSGGVIGIPISMLPTGFSPSETVWLKRTSSGDDWNNIGGEVTDGFLVSTAPFDSFSEFAFGEFISTSVNGEHNIPSGYMLYQNYPNPFNPSTNILFTVPERSHVRLEIFTITGRHVATLINDEVDAGYHEIVWDTGDWNLSSGVYFVRLYTAPVINAVNEFTSVRRMSLVR